MCTYIYIYDSSMGNCFSQLKDTTTASFREQGEEIDTKFSEMHSTSGGGHLLGPQVSRASDSWPSRLHPLWRA